MGTMLKLLRNRSTFNPSQIGGLIAWLDAADSTTITKDGSDLVSQWRDKGSGANHFGQATGTNQPTWQANAQNGLPGINFISNDYLATSGSVSHGIGTGGFSMFAVVKKGATTGNRALFTNGAFTPAVYLRNSTDKLSFYESSFTNFGTTLGTSNPAVLSLVRGGGNSVELWVNGVADGSNPLSMTTNWASATLGIGTSSAASSSSPVDAIIYEFALYNTTLTVSQRQAMENYLKTKWGL